MPGRVFIALTYTLEFTEVRYHYMIVYVFMLSEPIFLIFITLWYQFIDKGWLLLQVILLGLCIFLFLYYIIAVPESPKWLYTWLKFDECREVLYYVARFNNIPKEDAKKKTDFKFDAEGDEANLVVSAGHRSVAEYDMPTFIYVKNIVILAVQWSTASFSFYLV